MQNYKKLSERAFQFHQKGLLKEAEELYSGLLEINPDDTNILNLYSMLCLAKSETKKAIDMLSKALILNNNSVIMLNLAKAYHMDGDINNAIILYDKVIDITPTVDTYYSLGIAYKQSGNLKKAIETYKKALELNPDNYNVLYNLSVLYKDIDDIKNALKTAQKAEYINPNDEDIHTFIAGLYENVSNYKKSIVHMEKALQFNKNHLYYYNLGVLYSKIENKKAAIQNYQNVLELVPNHIESLVNISSVYKEIDIQKALSYIQKAYELNPKDELVRLGYARICRDMFLNAKSIELLSNMNNAEAFSLLAINYMDLGEYEKAHYFYEKALEIDKNSNYLHGKAMALKYLGYFNEAKSILESINEKTIQTETTLGMMYLQEKEFYKGMPLYIKRSEDTKFKKLFSKNIWSNQVELKDKVVLVYSDCGLGDTIMFSRYIPSLKKIAKKIIIQTDKELVSILNNSFKDIEVFSKSEKTIQYDIVIPIMNLPYALNLDFDNIPLSNSYLEVNSIALNSNKLKVGIFYQGNKRVFKNRSIDFAKINKLSDLNNIQLFSFQLENNENETNNIINLKNNIKDYSDTASLLKALDVLVTIDSSIAHMAGALGVKTYLLLPHTAEWRWFNDNETTPWYKSITIFKQKSPNDWDEVIERVKCKLAKNI